MSEVICDREFVLSSADEQSRTVVEWMKPERWRGDWRCEWTIYWPQRDAEHGYSVGVDSTQALLLGMALVSAILEQSGATWLDSSDLGLPSAPSRPTEGSKPT